MWLLYTEAEEWHTDPHQTLSIRNDFREHPPRSLRAPYAMGRRKLLHVICKRSAPPNSVLLRNDINIMSETLTCLLWSRERVFDIGSQQQPRVQCEVHVAAARTCLSYFHFHFQYE